MEDSDEDGETCDPVSGDEWRSRGALNARVAAEAADDPMAPPTQAKARLSQAKTCFANAQDADLKARCDVSTECLVELRSIPSSVGVGLGQVRRGARGYTKDAESKASAMVKSAVEALAIDDALRVLKLFRRTRSSRAPWRRSRPCATRRSRRRRRSSALSIKLMRAWGTGA